MRAGATAHLVRRLGNADETRAKYGIEGQCASGKIDRLPAAARRMAALYMFAPTLARANAEAFIGQELLIRCGIGNLGKIESLHRIGDARGCVGLLARGVERGELGEVAVAAE